MTGTSDKAARPRSHRRVFILLGVLLLLVAYVGFDLWAGYRVHVEVARFEAAHGSLKAPTYEWVRRL